MDTPHGYYTTCGHAEAAKWVRETLIQNPSCKWKAPLENVMGVNEAGKVETNEEMVWIAVAV